MPWLGWNLRDQEDGQGGWVRDWPDYSLQPVFGKGGLSGTLPAPFFPPEKSGD